MDHLRTEITIDAPPEVVWATLTDLDGWARWNPSFHDMQGEIRPGARLSFRLSATSRLRIRPKVVDVVDGTTFAWLGHLFGIPGIFDGEHRFTVSATGDGRTRVVQEERFSGLLRSVVLRRVGDDTRRGFEAMNAALAAEVGARRATPESA